MTQNALKKFCTFVQKAPTSWHVSTLLKEELLKNGFTPLSEKDRWNAQPKGRYFVQRGGTLSACIVPKKRVKGAIILASHTDSPALKLKPNPVFFQDGFPFFRVETYGSPILSTFLSRDLSLAGRLLVEDKAKKIQEKLIFFKDLPLIIPPLAIHLDREVNTKPKPIDKQEHLCPLIGLPEKGLLDEQKYFKRLLKLPPSKKALLGFDLYLVPIDPPRHIGSGGNMLASYRLDNLISVYSSLEALLKIKEPHSHTLQVATFFNHEEVGSQTEEGASSPFLNEFLKRLCLSLKMDEEDFLRFKSNSSILSIDLAHGLHPQYKKSYDPLNTPQLGQGVVIKSNANMRYATTGISSAKIAQICKKNRIPYTYFASHSNLPSGSTIGAITAAQTGIQTVDIGISLLSMHAAREIIANKDYLLLRNLLKSALEG